MPDNILTSCDTPSTGINIILNDKIVQKSHNLRGIITRAHKIGISSISIFNQEPRGMYYITFKDGSWTRGLFEDWSICRNFFRSRWRKWNLYTEVKNSDNHWSFF